MKCEMYKGKGTTNKCDKSVPKLCVPHLFSIFFLIALTTQQKNKLK